MGSEPSSRPDSGGGASPQRQLNMPMPRSAGSDESVRSYSSDAGAAAGSRGGSAGSRHGGTGGGAAPAHSRIGGSRQQEAAAERERERDRPPERLLVVKFLPARLDAQSEQFASELARHLGVPSPACRILRKQVMPLRLLQTSSQRTFHVQYLARRGSPRSAA